MEFHLTIRRPLLNVIVVDDAIRALDPAAILDIDGMTLRVATSLTAVELAAAITLTGWPVRAHEFEPMPSICCGGCSA